MTLEHVAAFLAGFGAGLLFAAIAWGRHTYRRPDRRHGLLTRRKWRDLPPFITKD